MRLLNIGSINIDYVYQVEHFLRAGETLEATRRDIFMGGKGLNQSVAAVRSGLNVNHAGVLGKDGLFILDFIKSVGIDTRFLTVNDTVPSGHTVIQVTPDAENAILYFAGTNHLITKEHLCRALDDLTPGDWVLMQNEVNGVPDILSEAKKRGLHTVFNPAPFSDEVLSYPLELVDVLIVNETEAEGILQTQEKDPEVLLDKLRARLPHAHLFLTLGSKGMICELSGPVPYRRLFPAYKVQAVDTTAAGDTFVGYAIGAVMTYFEHGRIEDFEKHIDEAMLAAAICVTQAGAVPSIPDIKEVRKQKVQL